MSGRGAASLGRLAVVCGLCAVLVNACSSPTRPRPSVSADPLAVAIAAEMDSYTVDDTVRAIIVQVGGRTRFEHYYSSTADESRSSFSVTKSVMSTLVGIAVAEGRLHLDDRLGKLLPQEAAAMKPQVARVTLRQLLTMTGGFPDTWNAAGDDPLYASPNWTHYIVTHQDYPPGTEFHYSDYGAHLLSPILARATGMSVLDYARAKLFDPLGITTRPAEKITPDDKGVSAYLKAQFAWPVDPQGFHTGATLLKLRPRDLARFGELFRLGGRWEGKQIVPAEWVRQATVAQAGAAFPTAQGVGGMRSGNYGYFWWMDKVDGADAYFALGFGGQRIEIVPARQLVIVVSAEVNLTDQHAPVATPGETQRLVDVIAPLAH